MKNKIQKELIILILVFLTLHIFILKINEIETTNNITNSFLLFFYQYRLSLENLNINTIFIIIITYHFYKNTINITYNNKKYLIILSLILTIITIIGMCYTLSNNSLNILIKSPIQIYKSIILTISYFITYYNIIKLLSKINITNINLKPTILEKKLDKKIVITTFLLILLCWLPYIVIFYPGGSTGDTADSIFQFFHNPESWTMNSIKLITPNIYINKHHSVLFTIILGSFIKIGQHFNSFDLGFYLYILFQVLIVISIFTFMIYYLKRIKIPFWIIVISILYICFSAVIILYSLTAVKDTLSASFTLLYIIFLFQIIKNYNSIIHKKIRLIILIITMLLVLSLRNNGIFTIIFSFPTLLLIYKKKRKKLLATLLLVITIFYTYSNILLPSLGISNGSIRELFSIPFMQLARTAKYHKKAFTKEEIKDINKVLDFDIIINNYNPDISDGVKNTYNKNSTLKENITLFKIWYKYFKKYPTTYIESILNSTYKYYYPVFVAEDLDVSKHYKLSQEYPEKNYFSNEKDNLNTILFFKHRSIFTIYFNIVALINWYLIFVIIKIIKNKQYKYIVPLSPLLSILLVSLASPLNGSPRYILPIYFSLPIIISINYLIEKKE